MKTIMLVDDEGALRRLVHITLGGDTRYRFVQADNGADAIRRARVEPVDLVLLDVAMPGMDGFDTCKALRELPVGRRPRVVMLSARSGEGDRERARTLGAEGYIVKPFSPLSLLDCVGRMMVSTRSTSAPAA
jgi:CheY-like chemotaxis protein